MKTLSRLLSFNQLIQLCFQLLVFFKQEIEGEMILFGRIILNKKRSHTRG
ncbi:Uncharacterised protein [Vibrio cholerae]|uniref:Uncharacterized protein n=1 Tax=Vibrio cholerae TaxID=666 RepID=A0A655WUN8_VIBCL|nr:Uncharacterised protein [Vibrio cholerae]